MVASFRACFVVALCSIMTAPTSANFIDGLKAKVTGMFAGAEDAAKKKVKETACAKPIGAEMDEVNELLEKAVEDECKDMKDKSDAAGACCMKKGKEIQSTIVGDNKKAQMAKCMAITKESDIPKDMVAVVKEGKEKVQKDLKVKLPKLQSCVSAAVKKVEDKASEAVTEETSETDTDTEEAPDDTETETEVATDADTETEDATDDGEDPSDGTTETETETEKETDTDTETEEATDDGDDAEMHKTEEKFELNGSVSPAAGFPLPAVASLVLAGLVASTVVVMRWRRHGARAMEVAYDSEAPLALE